MKPAVLKVFLRYAYPAMRSCIQTKIERGEASMDDLDMIRAHLGEDAELTKPPEGILKIFPGAPTLIRVISGKEIKDITEKDVRDYFWFHHDDAIDRRREDGEKFDHEKCEVKTGKVSGSAEAHNPGYVWVAFKEGKKTVSRKYDNRLAKAKYNDFVTVHFDHICESIKPKQHEMIKKRKMDRRLVK